MADTNQEIFEEVSKLDFVKILAEKYKKDGFGFSKETIKVEMLDEFGQCVVWLGFEDQFAIRDAVGNWREATAEECVALSKGELPGSQKLLN
ncbi:hypothetical protein [Rosenbergiella epipactidis]|uniref:hypothetical protein n=1 Tax=Rosenbergiella epipactidis TaxID=1544694 RepID=UPI001F4DF2F8|nr:hypothetical protein [Rosenbergiella epipactidis]